jgi:FolB domain-containing protein
MTDRIHVRDLEVWCVVGTLEEERQREQPVRIDLELDWDLAPAGLADDLTKTIDYADLAESVRRIAVDGKYYLIEAMAEAVARLCIDRFGVPRVRVLVKKPGAIRHARHAAVEISRGGG